MSKMLLLHNCWVQIDFSRAVAVDSLEIGTSNDCTARDPVRWMLLASADGVQWLLIDDQTSTSFPMPLTRSAFAPRKMLSLLQPTVLHGLFKNVSVSVAPGPARLRRRL